MDTVQWNKVIKWNYLGKNEITNVIFMFSLSPWFCRSLFDTRNDCQFVIQRLCNLLQLCSLWFASACMYCYTDNHGHKRVKRKEDKRVQSKLISPNLYLSIRSRYGHEFKSEGSLMLDFSNNFTNLSKINREKLWNWCKQMRPTAWIWVVMKNIHKINKEYKDLENC